MAVTATGPMGPTTVKSEADTLPQATFSSNSTRMVVEPHESVGLAAIKSGELPSGMVAVDAVKSRVYPLGVALKLLMKRANVWPATTFKVGSSWLLGPPLGPVI